MASSDDVYYGGDYFASLGLGFMRRDYGSSDVTANRRFRSLFGVSPKTCALLWGHLTGIVPSNAKPVHMMWSLLFLKSYPTEHVLASIVQCDEKTTRKWTWTLIEGLESLELVRMRVTLSDEILT